MDASTDPIHLCDWAHSAPWIILGVLLLGGLNFPISEDLVFILSGAVASMCIPDHTVRLFIWTYVGACFASWETYWIGRIFGPKLYEIKWFNRILNPRRIERLHYYYEKYGILVFIVGRFCPGGVRNALFLSSGLGKMPFLTYILRDGIAVLISSGVMFYLGYLFGDNYEEVVDFFKKYDRLGLALLLVVILMAVVVTYWRNRKKSNVL